MSSMIAVLPVEQYVQVQPSSVAQALCDLELWDRGPFGHHSTDPYTMAGGAFGIGSGFTVSTRRHVRCVVRRSCAGIVRDGPFCSGFLLLFPASPAFVGREA